MTIHGAPRSEVVIIELLGVEHDGGHAFKARSVSELNG
jgi:hypothetical protein